MEFFGIGLPELLVILVLTLIVVGPQRLPEMAAQLGRFMRDFRRYTSELTRDITDALQDIERETTEGKVPGAARDADAALKGEPEARAAEVTAAEPEGKVVSMEEARRRPSS